MLRSIRLAALRTDPDAFGSTYADQASYPASRWQTTAVDAAHGADPCILLAFRGGSRQGWCDRSVTRAAHGCSGCTRCGWRRRRAGGGVGRALLDAIEEWVRTAGGSSLELTVMEDGDAAQALYEASGYRFDGRRERDRRPRGRARDEQIPLQLTYPVGMGTSVEVHPTIFATTVCAIVEHGGELLMVRQLNREGEERWNFPTGWMAPLDEDGRVQIPEHVVNRNLLMETGYAASQATLIGVSLVREHDDDGRRIGTSTRLNYLSSQPRQTSYAINDSDILGAPEWFAPAEVEELIAGGEVKGQLTAAAFKQWRHYRESRAVLGRRGRHPQLTATGSELRRRRAGRAWRSAIPPRTTHPSASSGSSKNAVPRSRAIRLSASSGDIAAR